MSRNTQLTPDKDLRKLLKKLRKQGFETEKVRRNGHIRVISPEGEAIYHGSTASDHRSHKNFIAQLRRIGADI